MSNATLDAPIDALLDRLGTPEAVDEFLAELPEDELRYFPYAWRGSVDHSRRMRCDLRALFASRRH